MSLSLRRLGEERREAIERVRIAEKMAHEAVTAREEIELQVKSLQELKAVLESGDSQKQLVEWHNKNTELRFKVSTLWFCMHTTEFEIKTNFSACIHNINL
jgi:hypothetical protein